MKTWKIVNKNMSEIFSTLLPGAMAKLQIHDPQGGVEKGLELKVGFNNVWKESRSELSGGQKSLLALSLILALLKFQPAPLYILDEVDSALDLSHTQNIGQMIARFFKDSQFIVVSLKEGLFKNANVLFNVQFLDNRSQVKRIHLATSTSATSKNVQLMQENEVFAFQRKEAKPKPRDRNQKKDEVNE